MGKKIQDRLQLQEAEDRHARKSGGRFFPGLEKKLHSHAGVSFESDVISQAQQILKKLDPKTEIVAIDEAQWFGEELVAVVEKLLKK